MVNDAQRKAGRGGTAYDPDHADEIDLADYLAVLWRHRRMITALCLVAAAASTVWTLTVPRQYRSTTTIVPPLALLERQAGAGGALGSMGKSILRGVMDTTSVADIYAEVLKSREVSDAIVDRFHLVTVYPHVKFRSTAMDRLKKHTKIETTDQGAVKITVTDRDPNRAAAITAAYVQELDKQNKRLSTGEATSKRIFLENRLKEVETKLGRIDNMLAYEVKTQEMLYQTLAQELELAKIEEAKSMPTIQVLDPAAIPELPIPRGTVKKGLVAAVAALMLGVFAAFAQEYVADVRRRQARTSAAGYDIELSAGGPAPAEAPGASDSRRLPERAAILETTEVTCKSSLHPPKPH